MTVKDLVGLTEISEAEIQAYYRSGLIGREADGKISFDSNDAKNIGLIRRLKQFGMTEREIKNFFSLTQKGEVRQAVAILQALRERLINNIHEEQKSLDVLDCIIYETKNKSGGAL